MKAYIMTVRDMKDNDREKKNLDKIGGVPTHLLPLEEYDEEDCFLMQIYNDKGIWPHKENVLCWQFYQSSFGGNIDKIIEVPVDAELNMENKIRKRRWIGEYVIEYEQVEETIDESLSDEEYEERYYAPDTNIFCRSKIGGYCDRDDRAEYEMDGCTYVGLLSNFLCPEMELNLGTDKRTIVIDNETGKLQVV